MFNSVTYVFKSPFCPSCSIVFIFTRCLAVENVSKMVVCCLVLTEMCCLTSLVFSAMPFRVFGKQNPELSTSPNKICIFVHPKGHAKDLVLCNGAPKGSLSLGRKDVSAFAPAPPDPPLLCRKARPNKNVIVICQCFSFDRLSHCHGTDTRINWYCSTGTASCWSFPAWARNLVYVQNEKHRHIFVASFKTGHPDFVKFFFLLHSLAFVKCVHVSRKAQLRQVRLHSAFCTH